jgi:hypothetical protein
VHHTHLRGLLIHTLRHPRILITTTHLLTSGHLLGTGSSSSGNTMALIELPVIQRAIAAAGFPRVIDTMAAAFQASAADKTVVCPVQHLGPFRPSVSG